MRFLVTFSALLLLATLSISLSESHRVASTQREFDYFLLSLQWPGTYCQGTKHCCATNGCCRLNATTGFTIHGLWTDYNDGTWPSCCGGKTFDLKEIKPLLSGLQKYWPSLSCGLTSTCHGVKGLFWAHEWEKHGTCSYPVFEDEYSYFLATLNLYLKYNVLEILSENGYVPSNTEKYPLGGIISAIQNAVKATPQLTCKNGAIEELHICFYKTFEPRDCVIGGNGVGSSTCPTYVSLPEFVPLSYMVLQSEDLLLQKARDGMADGGSIVVGSSTGASNTKLTTSVIITCVVAASCGLIFGYDIGISGGVTTMEPFLKKFFPSVWRKMADANQNTYCVFDSQILTAFTSSLYIAGFASSLVASRVIRTMGRKATMVLGGSTFLIGAAIDGAAMNVAMLIVGRLLLGFGVGFTNQATPVYLSEMAPPKWRGVFNSGFQFFLGTGVVIASVINHQTAQVGSWGWRVSLGLAAAPAALMTTGALLISDTPSSLVERGKFEQAKKSLQQARGEDMDIQEELNELVKSSEIAKASVNVPFSTIFQRQYRPHLVMAVLIPFFQQLTGINVIAFYAPVLFQSVGFGNNSALLSAVILGVVNLVSIVLSMYIVDRFGRRVLFIEGGAQMILFQIAIAGLLGAKLGSSGDQPLSQSYAILVLVLMCLYAAGFGWSWGPLTWLIPSEIFPMKIRPVGQSISIAVNFATTFVLSQMFLAMLCHFKYYIFVFYAGWITVMTVFVALFLPETKGIPLESMHIIWEQHWYWKRFVEQEA